MTPEQKDIFISVARMGWACGLNHPYEWLSNYLNHTMNFLPYDQIPAQEEKVIGAFVAFFKETACCPEEDRGRA